MQAVVGALVSRMKRLDTGRLAAMNSSPRPSTDHEPHGEAIVNALTIPFRQRSRVIDLNGVHVQAGLAVGRACVRLCSL